MKIKVNKLSEPTCIKYLIFFITIMPFVDSLSGALHDLFPIGQVYRFLFFIYMLYMLMKYSLDKFLQAGLCFTGFAVMQVLISANKQKCIQDVVKLFTPIILIILLGTLLKRQKIEAKSIISVLEKWAFWYPALIIIPGIMGIGTNAYDGMAGWKGFFYAINEISFIVSCLIMFLIWKLDKKAEIKTIILLGLNILTLLLMGTKTGYATVAVFIFIYFFRSAKGIKQTQITRNIFILFILCIAAFCSYGLFYDEINAIFARWLYQKNTFSYSLIDFLTSHRLRRFDAAWYSFMHGKIWYIPLGCGFGAELAGFENMEMDWIDLFFRTGVLGTLFVSFFYIKHFVHICKKNFWGFAIMSWMMFLSFGAGHVLFYGQSGMMLGIMVVACYLLKEHTFQNDLIIKSYIHAS